jgi:SAM-dependent methyltransferase
MNKPFAESCERNKAPILTVLNNYFAHRTRILEIGSGTGQHAAHFAAALPHVIWCTSEMPENHSGIQLWLDEVNLNNLMAPVAFTVGQDPWPALEVDAVFTANTTHIMQPDEAKVMMQQIAHHLPQGGIFCQYGPMRVNGEFTTESNAAFDLSLKSRGFGGIRDIAELQLWGEGLTLIDCVEMPANNFLLVWEKR